MPLPQEKRLTWHNRTYSIEWLRSKSDIWDSGQPGSIFEWLKSIGAVPVYLDTYREFSAYPLLDKDAIKGEHLASLAIEWDNLGPSYVDDWLDMVEFECSGSIKRDAVRYALEAAREQLRG